MAGTSTPSGAADNPEQASYLLATGERLKPTEDPAAFETLDGSRRFTLRRLP